MYETTPAPGTTTWFGEVVQSGDDIHAANVQTYWSAASIEDRGLLLSGQRNALGGSQIK